MKKILVPTDFSETALNAFNFAKSMLAGSEAEITILHAFHPSAASDKVLNTSIDDLYSYRKSVLKDFVSEPRSRGNTAVAVQYCESVQIEERLVLGFAVDEILNMIESECYDMVIMGTSGEGGFFNKIFGSVSYTVAQKATCPVLLIPPQGKFQGIEKMAYASNYEAIDFSMIHQLTSLAEDYDSDIHFIHVNERKNEKEVNHERLLFEKEFKTKSPAIVSKVSTVEHATVWEGLYNYAEQEEIDMIVLATKQRSFLENVFHRSMTKRLMLTSKNIPLLVLHIDTDRTTGLN